MVLRVDHAFLDQVVEIDCPLPVALADENDRHRPDLARLAQGGHLEQFVKGAVAAGKGDERHRPLQEVQLAQRKIAEAEAQVRRYVRVGELLPRQADIESDRLRPGVERATVGGLDDARAARPSQ